MTEAGGRRRGDPRPDLQLSGTGARGAPQDTRAAGHTTPAFNHSQLPLREIVGAEPRVPHRPLSPVEERILQK